MNLEVRDFPGLDRPVQFLYPLIYCQLLAQASSIINRDGAFFSRSIAMWAWGACVHVEDALKGCGGKVHFLQLKLD